jgi:Tol biopolymer transport system component
MAGRIWSPGGSRVAFSVRTANGFLVMARTPGDPTVVDTLYESPARVTPTSWTDSGMVVQLRGQRDDIMFLDIESQSLTPLLATTTDEQNGRISPTGRWITYGAQGTGDENIYVRLVSGEGSRITATHSGGSQPAWGAGGTRIYFKTPDGGINWVSFDDETGATGQEVVLAPALTLGGGDGFDASPYGEQIAIVAWNDEEYNAKMEVVVNWSSEFAEKCGRANEPSATAF